MLIEAGDREIISMLISLGLNEREAKVYFILLTRGEKQAKEIANFTGIPQPHVYSILKSIQKKGIVDILQDRVKKYRAVSIDSAIDKLICEKENALISLRNKGHEAAQKIRTDKTGIHLVEFKPIIGRNEIDRKTMEMLQAAKRDVLGITSASKLLNYAEYLPVVRYFQDRKIAFRVLINFETEKIDKLKAFNDAGGEIKMLNKTNIPRKLIVDESVLLVDASFDDPENSLSFGIWTNHKDIVNFSRQRFMEFWEKGLSLQDIKTK